VHLYGLILKAGKFWSKDFEVTLGSAVAKSENLKLGDQFYGAHGLTGNGDVHKSHAYVVTGILKFQNNATDYLVLTNVASVWKMHEHEENHSDIPADSGYPEPYESGGKEITTLLIQYRSPMSVVMFPHLVNQSTNMQAASPAMESARLFSLIGIGLDTLQWFAIVIMLIAVISVFVSLYNSLKERKYDLALMRIMGARKSKIFVLVMLEGIMLTFAGTLVGILMGHAALEVIGSFQDSSQAKLTGLFFLPIEYYLLAAGLITGILAAVIPAIQAYHSDISQILSNN
jgi:putative ABC transport system permease protein